ncbi:HD family phosphohydrolase [Hydrogenophaga sp.]|uniref:HD family phosphohydrolase n=1 Tax=Hydrogenophaga sp. TaxID=1904254 RepID=UPI00272445A9|nr:HD family phosphohydrolase [Hydrogenophaga sp.]MDO9437825.1 HD domain-containing phosphohydrolase [Hydrogenophaga sp.]
MDLSDLRQLDQSARLDGGLPGLAPENGDLDAGSALVACPAGSAAADALAKTLRRSGTVALLCRPEELVTLARANAWSFIALDATLGSDGVSSLARSIRLEHESADIPIVAFGVQAPAASPEEDLEGTPDEWICSPTDGLEVRKALADLEKWRRLRRSHRLEKDRILQDLLARTSRLNLLIESGLMMSMERDRSTLLNKLLTEAKRLLHCDGATMYMVTDDKRLRFEMRTRDDALPAQEIALVDPLGVANESYVSVYTVVHNCSVLIDDVYSERRFDLSGTRAFDAASHYRTVSMLNVPISPRGGEPIGVLQFMNAMDPATGRIVPFDPDTVILVEALAAQAAVALDNIELVSSQKQLLESMIRVLATAIDAKSPYTGRHCERVPELAFLLADAASKASDGPLAAFAFRSEQEWQEFRIGAWLHDCGKIATPEHVIDKATKLETIYNRIHEIRTRFEVLLRDLEIERLRDELKDGPCLVRDAEHARRRASLFDDFSFVAQCNVGSETMADAEIERLLEIADRPWVRHFDDRLGLSVEELARRSGETLCDLPVLEKLLSDRSRDVVPRNDHQKPDPRYGFKMDVPQNLYNLGELYNLSVRRGTLTAEERYTINEHMVHTIMMLEQMPFPNALKRVPEYAGTHHERMDGKGYPRRLSSDALSVPSRIMAIADIFEALTAADRPYKKAKPLSEALTILRSLAGTHVDPDVFNLLLTSKIFLTFARRFLQPEQIDVVDGTAFLIPRPQG